MNTSVKAVAVGAFAYFFRDGDLIEDASPSSRTNIPETDPADAGWLLRLIGNIESFEDVINDDNEQKIKGPAGQSGVIVTRDVVQTGAELELKFTTNEMTRLAAQCFYRTQNISEAAVTANPLSSPPPKGWLLIQRYDQDGQAHLVGLVYCRLKVTGGFKGGDGNIVKPEWSALVLWDYNNVFSL